MSGAPPHTHIITSIVVKLESGFYLGQRDWKCKWCVSLSGRDGLQNDFLKKNFLTYSFYKVGHMLGLVIANGGSIGHVHH